MSAGGSGLRTSAVEVVDRLLDDPNTVVLPQSRESFLDGLGLYRTRPDRAYSLTDCISMATMRKLGLTDVLTHDRHFEQEGFNVLMQREGTETYVHLPPRSASRIIPVTSLPVGGVSAGFRWAARPQSILRPRMARMARPMRKS